MSLALETVCAKFGMKLTEDPATRVVALKIIELAQRGVRDSPTLSEMTLKELKHYLPFGLDTTTAAESGVGAMELWNFLTLFGAFVT
jgi:hypothetical protein